ncbi:hypothetical protein [Listeria sp. PSOL-1]|uniref:hypothetical protein n=1 Tax=Listeria sp. PSOL-1 TaxID=1844999 RepID=UPI0013CF79FA|nr:hypothetical protein [Listeria sp. PSOL-1]
MNKKIGTFSIATLSISLLLLPQNVSANNYIAGEKLASLEKNLSLKEAKAIVEDFANSEKISNENAEQRLTSELSSKLKQEENEEPSMKPEGGSSGQYTLSKAKSIGDIYYTSSQTMNIPHGHVGMYYKEDRIVESTPETGVHTLAYNGRKVEENALMQEVIESQAVRTAAANWALSRAGKDGYSYNFVTNRMTSHYGEKNCSKLVWSAYKVEGDIDIDKDEGAGVYPRDIRDSIYTQTYKVIK